jgi:hypothetical protein
MLVAGFVGYQQWQQFQKEEARKALLHKAAEQRRLLEQINQRSKHAQSIHAVDHPWAKLPAVSELSAVCTKAINRIPLSVNGWLFEAASCQVSSGNAQLTISFKRTARATEEAVVSGMNAIFQLQPQVTLEGDSATVSMPLQTMFGGDDSLLPIDQQLSSLKSHFQTLGILFGIEEKKPVIANQPASLPGAEPVTPVAAAVPPAWKTYGFSVKDTGLGPAQIVQNMPVVGVRLTNLNVKLEDHSARLVWSAAGEIYGK